MVHSRHVFGTTFYEDNIYAGRTMLVRSGEYFRVISVALEMCPAKVTRDAESLVGYDRAQVVIERHRL